ncbi:MAG: PAS domain-containing protein [Planctomycetota bacterium]|jgi:PAS domain S-box-containing protein|nr:PAS domain-containing protein [Planctomycetota bacterium]
MASPDAVASGFALRSVSLRRAAREMFHDLDFRVERGEIHALVGGRHEGKSDLCSLFAGEIKPDSGDVVMDGGRWAAKVTDSPSVFPNLSVGNNLILSRDGGWRSWLSLKHVRLTRLREWLAANDMDIPLEDPLFRMPREDWVFIQILNRLYNEPRLLIFDEALEELAPARFRQLWPLLEKKRDGGMSFLWVTNKIESALVLADRVSVIRDRRILLTDSAKRLDRIGIIRLCHGFLETEQDFPTSEEQFHQILRNTEALLRDLPNAVVITDMDMTVRFVNQSAAKLFGIPQRWTMNSRLADIVGAQNTLLAERINEALAAGDDREWHCLPVELDGDKRLVDMRIRRFREGEIPVGHMVVIEDVSMRETFRQRLMLSENLASVGLLAAGVAHEVNNPLEVMENYLHYLSETEDDGERRDILAQITNETRNIKETVRQLVAFSGQRKNARVKTDMPRLARELCSLLRFQVKGKGIDFECTGPNRKALVVAAPNEMRQMLLNLLRNSIDAMRDGGVIRVDLDVEEPEPGVPLLRLKIDDEGTGIDAERIQDIFLPFVSTKQGMENHQGLGLSIVYAIVENCGGKIGVENREEGGCRFVVTLPCMAG